jgi:phosphoglycerate dehydrogenase-like enzyme
MLPPNLLPHWPEEIRHAVPECEVLAFDSPHEAAQAIRTADAVYGTVPPELFATAERLQWIAAPKAGLGPEWFYPALVKSDVVVTNTRGIFDDHLSHHALGLIVAHSRHFDAYRDDQAKRIWGTGRPIQHLPDCTLLVIGCGAAGRATARLAKAFGMHVLATDAHAGAVPDGVDELHPAEALLDLLPRADYVVMLVPETPNTLGMMGREEFMAMKRGSYFINLGRGRTVSLDALVAALQSEHLAGAALDVFEIEPLPPDHVLWGMPNVRITPHVAGEGPYCWERRLELLIENLRRFATGKGLLNVVDKRQWF